MRGEEDVGAEGGEEGVEFGGCGGGEGWEGAWEGGVSFGSGVRALCEGWEWDCDGEWEGLPCFRRKGVVLKAREVEDGLARRRRQGRQQFVAFIGIGRAINPTVEDDIVATGCKRCRVCG